MNLPRLRRAALPPEHLSVGELVRDEYDGMRACYAVLKSFSPDERQRIYQAVEQRIAAAETDFIVGDTS